MQEYPLFPKVIRLVLYAGTAIASLASVPAIIDHSRKALAPMVEDDAAVKEVGAPAAAAAVHHSAGTISIQPAGEDAAARRRSELLSLQAKLAGTAAAK